VNLGIGILALDERGELLLKGSEDRIGSTVLHVGLETWEVVGGWRGSAWCDFVRIGSGTVVKKGIGSKPGFLGPTVLI